MVEAKFNSIFIMGTVQPIREENGVLVSKNGMVLTNYATKIIAVVREHACMTGVVVNHPPQDGMDAADKE